MVNLEKCPRIEKKNQIGYRLINSKFPPIALFDDVASEEDFEALYALQQITNPRLLTEIGQLNLIPRREIPFSITGCSYATAPFTHVNPDGSRFSNGAYGLLYIADSIKTAISETRYHQGKALSQIEGLNYDVITMRGLFCRFSGWFIDIKNSDRTIYSRDDYTASQQLGINFRQQHMTENEGLEYTSVRNSKADDAVCWALFTPRSVAEIKQTAHFEFIFDGKEISQVNQISKIF